MTIQHEMITGRYTLMIEDGIQDEDHRLDEVALNGTVLFTPVWPTGVSAGRVSEPPRLVSTKPVKALIADGEIVSLSGTVSEIGEVKGGPGQELPVWFDDMPLWWRATFKVSYGQTKVVLPSVLIDATEGPVDLTTLVSAGGFPEADTSDLDSIIATIRQMSRDAEKALRLATEAAEEASALTNAVDEAVSTVTDLASKVETTAASVRKDAERVGDAAAVLDARTRAELAAKSSEESAVLASNHEGQARAEADRAHNAANDVGEAVTAKIAEVIDGAPEDLDTLRELAEYAQENREITDTLNAAIGAKADRIELDAKANRVHTHALSDVNELTGALDGKSDKGHKHTVTDISGLEDAIDEAASAVMDGKIQVVESLPVTPTPGVFYAMTGATPI